MRLIAPSLILATLLTACSTMRDTAMVTDDVYDIPDRHAMAMAKASAPAAAAEESDYYDPSEARSIGTGRDYYDLAYNDPYYYNYGRFGFGTGIGAFGPSYGMGLSYGWPTSFGSMSLYYGTSYGMYGYNPYWSNSWMSGYGYWPSYSAYNPYGYYGYGNYGPGWGGYGMGYGPYHGPWGSCYGCYEPVGYGQAVYGHRPAMASGTAAGSPSVYEPRRMRNPAGLMPSAPSTTPPASARPGNMTDPRPARTTATPPRVNDGQRPTINRPVRPDSRPTRTWDSAPAQSRPSDGGNFGGGGGGRVTSPRPR
ncbi:MAG TPA: hypothetical protein PKD45_01595 [Flavobacteriales bacterium]|nr:hypothetical protein [Flavobacteriales bacterium]